MSFLYLLWRNLTRKKVRTTLTLGSIFIAFILFSALLALKTAFSAGVDIAGLDRLITMHKVSLVQPVPIAYQNKMEQVDGVARVANAMWFGGVYQDPKNFFAQFAVDPERYLDVYPEIQLSDEARAAWIANRTGAIVGQPTADRFSWKVGDKIPIQGTIFRRPDGGAWEFDIVGIYTAEKGFDDTALVFQRDYLTESFAGIDGFTGWYVVRVSDPDRSAAIAEEIDALFANSPAETKTSTEKAFAQGFANQMGNIGTITTGILTVVFFTLLLVAGNTMAQSVRERISEIGVLKTLGFTHGQTLGLVLGESYLLTLLGGGTALALMAWVLNSFDLGGGMFPVLYLPTWGILLGCFLLLFMGFAAGAIPAWQAHRLTIVDALRRKG
ncbi:MAG: ABC transporter permease [Thermoanaerobaculia bacterium]|nr:ABC transporter permease [Thermoanaerobaculia bacterium]